MVRARVGGRSTDFHAESAGRGVGSLLGNDGWLPSGIGAISPLVERLMRPIESCRCITGEQPAVEVASRENLTAERGRGIHVMERAMDELSFERRGTDVHMYKKPPRDRRSDAQSELRGF